MSIFEKLPNEALVNELVKRFADENNKLRNTLKDIHNRLVEDATVDEIKEIRYQIEKALKESGS
jgi:hypothetical protein